MGRRETLGLKNSKTRNYIEEEFKRLVRRGRNHLVLQELLRFRTIGLTLPVDLCHLGVLWVLDRCDYGDRLACCDCCGRGGGDARCGVLLRCQPIWSG